MVHQSAMHSQPLPSSPPLSFVRSLPHARARPPSGNFLLPLFVLPSPGPHLQGFPMSRRFKKCLYDSAF